jgi:hypothetical protein
MVHTNNMYTVVGLGPDDPTVTPELGSPIRIQCGPSSSRKLKRDVIIRSVGRMIEPVDFNLLSSWFGAEFVRFLLLNDVAVEACRAVNFSFKSLGAIAETNFINPSTLLTCPFWT